MPCDATIEQVLTNFMTDSSGAFDPGLNFIAYCRRSPTFYYLKDHKQSLPENNAGFKSQTHQ